MEGYKNNLDQKHLTQDIKNQIEEKYKNQLHLLKKQRKLNCLRSFFVKDTLLEKKEKLKILLLKILLNIVAWRKLP